jgi:hypothetical protein
VPVRFGYLYDFAPHIFRWFNNDPPDEIRPEPAIEQPVGQETRLLISLIPFWTSDMEFMMSYRSVVFAAVTLSVPRHAGETPMEVHFVRMASRPSWMARRLRRTPERRPTEARSSRIETSCAGLPRASIGSRSEPAGAMDRTTSCPQKDAALVALRGVFLRAWRIQVPSCNSIRPPGRMTCRMGFHRRETPSWALPRCTRHDEFRCAQPILESRIHILLRGLCREVFAASGVAKLCSRPSPQCGGKRAAPAGVSAGHQWRCITTKKTDITFCGTENSE